MSRLQVRLTWLEADQVMDAVDYRQTIDDRDNPLSPREQAALTRAWNKMRDAWLNARKAQEAGRR